MSGNPELDHNVGLLHMVRVLLNLAAAATLIVGVELVLAWSEITDNCLVTTTAQLFPLLLSICLLLHQKPS